MKRDEALQQLSQDHHRALVLRGEDETLHKSVMAIADDLTEDGFVLRYVTTETDDGLSGKKAAFRSAPSGWSQPWP
jgi:GH15 family glucan-1,4-alpha-glucosidase